MESADMTQINIDKIAELFPQVVTEIADQSGAKDEEGKPLLKKAIDFEKLRFILSAGKDYALKDDDREHYEFTWVGKHQAMVDAATPIHKTLRPCPDESKNWDNTENLYIEGDNLEVLKLLQESYLGKIKMIYIDPPYNTGNDFIYKDNFKKSTDEYENDLGLYDEDENKLFQNTETNGRFHSDWCSMIYPRLQLARNLLTDDGVIFISIDDNEQASVKSICNEIFGEMNFLECLIWKKRATPPNDKNIGRIHEFILVYVKDINKIKLGLLPRDFKSISRYSNPDNDIRGPWVASDLSANGKGGRIVQSCIYPIVNPIIGKEFFPSEGRCWLFSKEKMDAWIKDGRVAFRENTGAPFLKRYISEVRQGLTLPTILTDFGYSQTSAAEADKIFNKKGIFEYAKPTTLLNPLVRIGTPNNNNIILDFFSGSATTAHAVMQLNTEDGGNRKFIMVQLPEKCDEKSEAYKAGYKNICEIGKERIRRAGAKIEAELKENNSGLFDDGKKSVDTGFRVFKLDTTNMKDVYYSAGDYSQKDLWDSVSNIKDDRTDIDLLYGCLLDWGVQLTMKHVQETIDGSTVHFVGDNELAACFDKEVSETTVREIATHKPMRAVFRDWSFRDSADKINVTEIFKAISPDTTIKVI